MLGNFSEASFPTNLVRHRTEEGCGNKIKLISNRFLFFLKSTWSLPFLAKMVRYSLHALSRFHCGAERHPCCKFGQHRLYGLRILLNERSSVVRGLHGFRCSTVMSIFSTLQLRWRSKSTSGSGLFRARTRYASSQQHPSALTAVAEPSAPAAVRRSSSWT